MEPGKDFTNRIICGAALHVLTEIPDRSIDLIVTDPPYGDNTSYGVHHTRIAGNEHPLAGLEVLAASYRVLKPNRTAYMFCGMRHLAFVRSFFDAYTRFRVKDVLIWDKVTMGVGAGFRKQYECILVLEKGKPTYHNRRMLNVLGFPRVRFSHHPHAKPVELIRALINHSSEVGDVVMDPFAGSGTTCVAASQIKRQFIGIEADKTYHKIAVQTLSTKSGSASSYW